MSLLRYLAFKPSKVEERFFLSLSQAAAAANAAASSAVSSNTNVGTAFLDNRVRISKSATKGYGLLAVEPISARSKVLSVPKNVWVSFLLSLTKSYSAVYL